MVTIQGGQSWELEVHRDAIEEPHSMFDPMPYKKFIAGPPEVTVTLRDGKGAEYKLQGAHITSMQTGTPEQSVPIVPDNVTIKGEFVPDPPPAPANETTIGDGVARPFPWESYILAVMGACWIAGCWVAFRAVWRLWL